MSDTAETGKAKKQAVAIRDWLDANYAPLATGDEAKTIGFRYIHLPSARKANAQYNPETDPAPQGTSYDCDLRSMSPEAVLMLATFGGLTLAGNVVNSAVNGPKGDPNINPISLIEERFKEIDAGTWAERAAGVGGVRYDKDKLAAAIASAKGETDPAPYLARMDKKVDPKTGAEVAADTKGAISYGARAMRNAAVKAAYDALTGGGTSLDSI